MARPSVLTRPCCQRCCAARPVAPAAWKGMPLVLVHLCPLGCRQGCLQLQRCRCVGLGAWGWVGAWVWVWVCARARVWGCVLAGVWAGVVRLCGGGMLSLRGCSCSVLMALKWLRGCALASALAAVCICMLMAAQPTKGTRDIMGEQAKQTRQDAGMACAPCQTSPHPPFLTPSTRLALRRPAAGACAPS